MSAADEKLSSLMRVLRRYALHPVGPRITEDLLELAEDGRVSMTAMEVGSLERQSRGIASYIYKSLAELLVEMADEQGHALLDARESLEDIDPSDFDGEPW